MTITNIYKVLGFIFLLLYSADVRAQQESRKNNLAFPPTVNEVLKWHETFTYEVKYSFFRLGEVKVDIFRDTLENTAGWVMKTVITSNSSLPFVGKEENHYNSFFVMEDSMPKELYYWRDNVDEEEYKDLTYFFDWDKHKVYAKMIDEPADTLELEEGGGSGQLIFLMARTFAGTQDSLRMPVYIERKQGFLEVQGTTKTEKREYDAFDEAVKTFYSEGNTTIEGPFGFKGSFKSWYMANELRIPLEAYVRVWLGNVKIRLTKYTKEPRK